MNTPAIEAVERYKLYKLPWDIVGSEFAGPTCSTRSSTPVVVRNQSDREAPWEKFHGIVDGLLDKIDIPGDTKS